LAASALPSTSVFPALAFAIAMIWFACSVALLASAAPLLRSIKENSKTSSFVVNGQKS